MTSTGSRVRMVTVTGSAGDHQDVDALCPARDSGMPCRRGRGRGAEVVRGSRGVQVAHLRGGAHGGPVWAILGQAGRRRRAAAHPQPEAHARGPSLSSRTRPERILRWDPCCISIEQDEQQRMRCIAPAAHLKPDKHARGLGVSSAHVMRRAAEQPDRSMPRAKWTLRSAYGPCQSMCQLTSCAGWGHLFWLCFCVRL